jgi:hypothetical protein
MLLIRLVHFNKPEGWNAICLLRHCQPPDYGTSAAAGWAKFPAGSRGAGTAWWQPAGEIA